MDSILFRIVLSVPAIVIAIIMGTTVLRAKKGSIVTINTIKGVGLAGIIISALMILTRMFAAEGIVLLGASILYRLSTKNIKFAKIGAILAGVAILLTIAIPVIFMMR